MELYVGGCGQEKLKAVLDGRKRGGGRTEVFYGEDILSSRIFHCQVINHFHLIIKKLPQSDIPLFLEELYEKNPDVTIICDEVGNGIVPVEKEERLYREQVGKSCQWLAARSRRVVRIVCGCMQVLKEEKTESGMQSPGKAGGSATGEQKEEKTEASIRLCFIRHGETAGNLEKRYVGRTDEPLSPVGMENMRQLRKRMLLIEKTRDEKMHKNRKACESGPSAQSRMDSERTDEGVENTEESCLDKLSESFPKLYISPMRRCRESAEVLFSSAEGDSQKPRKLSYPFPETGCLESSEVYFPPVEENCRESSGVLYTSAAVDCQEVFDFRECDFGAFEYHNYRELMQDEKLSPLYQAWIDSGGRMPFPEGEPADQFKKRCVHAFDEIMARNKNEKDVLFLVHGGTIMAILEARGEPKKGYYDYQVPCADGYVCEYLPERGIITNIERLKVSPEEKIPG